MVVQEEKRTDFGTVKIHQSAVASCAMLAAKEVGGVLPVPRTILLKVVSWLTKGRFCQESVKVEFGEHNEIKITISIAVQYGLNIPEVASAVQESIKKTVEKTTGLYLTDVDVKVKGVCQI
ncbi:MAG: Asp23/Gls24 family envelope stress response protein [Candidatus Omnitrophota bacterium]